MRNYGIRSIAMMLVAFLIVQTVAYGISMPSFADAPTGLTINYRNAATGTEPFNTLKNSAPGYYPGDDYSSTDSYVRTLDTVSFTVDYSVNPAGTTATGTVIESVLEGSNHVVWDSSMKDNYVGVDISADGRTLTYDIGNVDGGQAFSFTPLAKILGDAPNGDTFKAKFTIKDNTSLVSYCESDAITISASPKFDLKIDTFSKKSAKGPNGEQGLVVFSTVEILMENGKGSEIAKTDLLFDVDLSEFRNSGINPILYDFATYNTGITPNFYLNSEGYNSRIPWSRDVASDNAVKNPTEYLAAQVSKGSDVGITIKGADLSGNNLPVKNGDGTAVGLDDKYLVSGILALWMPASELPDSDTEFKISYKNFDPNSISGLSNFSSGLEPMGNNSDSIIVKKSDATNTGGGGSYLYADMWYSYLDGKILYGEDDQFENRGYLALGENFKNTIKYGVGGDNPSQPNAYVVYKFDPTNLELVEQANGNPYVINFVNGTDINDFIVEFGSGSYGTWEDMRIGKGEDADSVDGWHEDYKAVNGEITKIRIRNKSGIMPGNSNISLSIMLRVKADAPVGGSMLGYLSYKADNTGGGYWYNSSYKLDINDPLRESRAENAFVTGVKSRVEILSSKNKEKAGNNLDITLNSTVTSSGVSGTAKNVVLSATLPKGVEYVSGTSTYNGGATSDPQKVVNGDGTTTISFALGDRSINTAIGTYKFTVKLDSDIKNQTVLGFKGLISTPTDYSSETLRSSLANVTVTNDRAWGINKKVDKDVVEVGEDLSYKLRYFQTTTNILHNFTFIDVLPYKGDGRTPATNFDGSYSLKSVTGYNGEVVYVTDDAPGTINVDPNLSTNNWVPLGSIPNQDVTGIKITVADFPNSMPTREIDVTLSPNGNTKGNIYTNKFYGRTTDLLALVESNEITIRVIASSINGYVWRDTSNDGVVDSSEGRFSNKIVELYDSSNTLVATTNTDSNGKYVFSNLKSDSYSVILKDDMSGFKQSFESDGSLDKLTIVNTGKDQDINDVNFGYQELPGSMSGYVWEDSNNDGVVDGSESRFNNKAVELYDSSDVLIASTKTDSNGFYIFDKQYSGNYKIVVSDTFSGYKQVFESDSTLNQSIDKNLSPNEIATNINFGYMNNIGKVVVKYVDAKTNAALNPDILLQGNIGDGYTTEQKTFDKYSFVKVEGEATGSFEASQKTVTYFYDRVPDPVKTGRVIVTHKVGTSVIDSEDLGEKPVGTLYSTNPTSKSEYSSYKVIYPANRDGSYIEGTVEVIYFYIDINPKPVTKGTVIVKYLENGTDKVLSAEETTKGDVSTDYSTTVKTIDGYIVGSIPLNSSGKYIDGTITVTYYYDKNPPKQGTVVTKYLENGTNTVLASDETSTGDVDSSYSTVAKNIDGYTLNGTPSNSDGKYIDGTINVVYIYDKNPPKQGTVIVKHLENGTNTQLLADETTKGNVDSYYVTASKSISGYTLASTPSNGSGKYVDGTIVVTYYYGKIVPNRDRDDDDDDDDDKHDDKVVPKDPDKNTTPDNSHPADGGKTPGTDTTTDDGSKGDNNSTDTYEHQNPSDVDDKDTKEVEEVVDEDIIISIEDEEVPKGNKEVDKEKKTDTKNNDAYLEDKRKRLPQTGETDNSKNSLLGVLLMLLGTVVALKRKDR